MDFAIAKMSTKGQIVIPSALRNDFQAGEEFLMVKDRGNLVLKRINDLAKTLKTDLKFSSAVNKAWKEYEAGHFTSLSKDNFLKELDKW